MKLLPLLIVALSSSIALTACNNEPQPTEGDAEIVKQTPKNTNPASLQRRNAVGATAKDMAVK